MRRLLLFVVCGVALGLALAGSAAADFGRPERVVLVGQVDRGHELAALVRRRGGSVRLADDRAGFVIAELAAGSARALGRAPGVAVAVDRKGRVPRAAALPRADRRELARATQVPSPGPINPYLPSGDIGAPQFVRDHPGFDGRDVRIAVIESLVDWTAPGMQTTTTGERKVTRAYHLGPESIVVTDRVVRVSGGRFVIDGQEYALPAARRARFGVAGEQAVGRDLNIDGDSTDAFAVAVMGSGAEEPSAFVDTDQDRSFADETRLTDWNGTHATATFGVDRPDTEQAEVLPFGLNLCQDEGLGPCAAPARARGDAWSLVTPFPAGTWRASVAAGHELRLGGGRFDGVAPGAEVWGFSPHGPDRELFGSDFAAAVLLAAREGADVINVLSTLHRLFMPGGEDVLSPLVDNVIAAYGVSVVAPVCCNVGLGANHTAPQSARRALLAGDAVGGETFGALHGRPIRGERLHFFSPYGPHGGSARPLPDVVAPGASLVAAPTSSPSSGPLQDVLPAGYHVRGNAMASSQAAGAVALLISAARAERVPYTPHTLKRALELGARPLRGGPDYTRAEIGHGLIRLDRAWRWLERLGRRPGEARELVTTVAADTTTGTGHGIYQRVSAREIETVTVTTGERVARTYTLSADQPWIGLDRTSLTIPASGSATFAVRIDPSVRVEPDTYAGTVTLDDPSTIDPADHELPVTIVTPHRFDPAGRVHLSGRVPAEATHELFVVVPPGTRSLVLHLTRPVGEPAGADLYYHRPTLARGFPGDEDLWSLTDPPERRTATEIISDPMPGTWRFVLHGHETNRPAAQPVIARHPYDLTLTRLGGG
jgi:Subtilase family